MAKKGEKIKRIIDSKNTNHFHYGNARAISEEILDAVISKEIKPGEAYRQLLAGGIYFFYKEMLCDATFMMFNVLGGTKDDNEAANEVLNNALIEHKKIISAMLDFSRSMEELEGDAPFEIDNADIELRILFTFYPNFKKDYMLLKDKFFIEIPGGLKWIKSIQSLAEYFGNQNTRNRWSFIEAVFKVENLKNHFSTNGNPFKGNSKDYQKLLELKNTPKGK
ncbi:hypothetical protein AGMMS49942_00840 [Spirochaetia bacterium]|nr:hypothetical protein AGMMS49942_00840 [Spirochaetia bacterium]